MRAMMKGRMEHDRPILNLQHVHGMFAAHQPLKQTPLIQTRSRAGQEHNGRKLTRIAHLHNNTNKTR